MQPLFTVSIVTYHTKLDMLQAALDSLKSCTLPHAVVIVDNSVNDAYFAALQQAVDVPCVQAPRNGGYGYGHNLAMKYMPRAKYHLVLNPDVVVHAGCIETLIDTMEKTSAIGLTLPKVFYSTGQLQPLNKRTPTVLDLFLRRFVPESLHYLGPVARRLNYYAMLDKGYDESCDVPFASGCFMLFRRAVWEAIGGFDERYFLHFEDADISRKTWTRARVVFVPQSTVTHVWTRNSHSSLKFTLITIKSAYLYFQKWGWRLW